MHETHKGLEDCLNMLLSCFRKRKSGAGGAREAEAVHLPRVQPPVGPEGHDGDAHEAAHRREALRVRHHFSKARE